MNDRDQRIIDTDEELARVRRCGEGHVFSRFCRTLHHATCRHVDQMTTGESKLWYRRMEAEEARVSLDERYGKGQWRRCEE